MRLGGIFTGIAPLALGACAASGGSSLTCNDGVSVHFPRGGDELNLAAVNQVLRTVSTLDACPSAKAIVTGHADAGEHDGLSGRRAVNVASVLAKNGVERTRITVRDAGPGEAGQASRPDSRFVDIVWD